MKTSSILRVVLLVFLGLLPCRAASPSSPGVDSRKIVINSLDQPVKLSGKWLFTRADDPRNALENLDTRDWLLIRTPGPWKHVYPDKNIFTVGWYRGVLEFHPSLVGQEAVFLVDTYMGRINVFSNGQEIYRRPGDINVQRYYSIQPVPVRFKITQPSHVLAFRVETPLMTGVYQLPFELHRYDPLDRSLAWYQFRGGELRIIVGFSVLFFGLFFLLVYGKTKYPLYLVAAMGSLVVFPFAAFPTDFLLKAFSPETLLYLHYPGLFSTFFAYLFSQFFYKFTPRFNWILGVTYGLLGLVIGSMAFFPNVDLFQHVRTVYFLLTLYCGIGGTYVLVRGVLEKRPGAGILLVGILVFLGSGINDLLLALGRIQSTAWMFTGTSVFTFTMLYAASNIFANTFIENKHLLKELKGINDRLEDLVAERTQQLRQKTNDISAMLQNMPQGILTITEGGVIHPEYSVYLETIFETKQIAGENLMDLVFSSTSLGADALAQAAAIPGVCIGEDRMNFEFNTHVMIKEFEKRMADGRVKTLDLLWSPICNEQDVIEKLMLCVRDTTEVKRLAAEAAQQKRELEIIGQILSVSQEKFHEFIDSSTKFLEENAEVIRLTMEKHPDVISKLFRNMHTIKGNARTYGLLHLTNKVHESEQQYDDLRKNPNSEWVPERLLAQLEETHSLIAEYAKINDHKLGRKGPGRRGSVEKYLMVEKEQIQHAIKLLDEVDRNDATALQGVLQVVERTLSLIGTENVRDTLEGIIESMPSLASELGKLPPKITIQDHGIVIRNQATGLLKHLFTHLYRNAVDHGIEQPEERLAAGKSPEGNIDLELSLPADGSLQMVLRDDGRGLPIAKLLRAAREKKILAEGETPAPGAIAQLIFVSGLSTAEVVTEVSGRGVGMDAVKGFLEREGGSIEIRFLDTKEEAEFRPFETVIRLPGKFAIRVHK